MKAQNLSYKFRILTFLSVVFFTFSDVALSQTSTADYGKITGKVVDSETGETVIGANVVISGTSKGDATDIDGKYTIESVQPGIYSLTISYISYTRKTVTGVEVNEGEITTVNVQLQPQTLGLEEVVVQAQAATNSEAGLLSIQRKSVSVQDGLSSEFLSKTGDGNIASAMKRVTGVTLIDGQDVYVRGLGNRYSNIQLNGSQVPSTSPNKKEAPIDLVGSGLVDNVVVQKTYSPDQSGEFSGGSVQITTREFPDEPNFSLSYSTSYTSVSTFDGVLSYKGSSTDFIGFDNGKRSLPSAIANQRLSRSMGGEVASQLHDDWNIKSSTKAIPSQSVSINYADQFNEDKLPIGLVSNFSYKYNRSFEPDKTLRKIQSDSDTGSALLRSDYVSDVGIENAKLSGMLNLFVKPNETTKIGLKNLYSNSANNSTHRIVGDFINAPAATRQTILDFDRRTIFSSTLELDKAIVDFFDSRITANISFSKAIQDRPDRRTTQYNERSDGSGDFNIFFDTGGNTHYFARQDDNNYSSELKYEFKPSNLVKFKVGGSGLLKDRDFDARKFEYRNFGGTFPQELASESPNVTLNSDLVEDGLITLRETSSNDDSYNGNQELLAGYLSTIWYLVDHVTWEIGARIENSDQEVSIFNNTGQTEQIANLDNTDLLPATNLTYSFNDKTNLRGAFSFTLARPEFREISDFFFQDFIGGQIVFGNPDLQRTKIQNYDLRLETYPNPGELFAISAFYKHFDKPIELFYRFTERSEVQYNNGDEAILYGLELEGRKNITERFQVVANGSFIFSETKVTDPSLINRVTNTERPMYGQSPYTVNLSTFYQFPGTNLDVSLTYNTFGKRVVTVGKTTHPDDEYEQPFHNVGFNATYNYGSAKFTLGLENLLFDEREYKQGDVTTLRYEPGMTAEVGISFTF